MTETAREALLRRSKEGKSSETPKKSARELLAERASGKTFELPKDTSKPDPPAGFGSPYSYYTPEVQRSLGNTGEGLQPVVNAPGAIASGFNRGVAGAAGMFADTAQSAVDVLGTGYSAARSKITGEDPNELYQVPDRAQLPLTGEWIARQLDSTPMGNITQNPSPNHPSARILHNAAAGAAGGMVGGTGGLIPGAAGGAAGAVGAELGLDPASQTAISMLAGAGASKIAERIRANPKPPEPDPIEETQAKLNEAASKQSMGAAGASVDLKSLSPDLQEAVKQAVKKTGGAVNPEVLARQVQADSLPVKVRLSEGQSLGDERLISLEQNAKGKNEAYSKGFQEQNKALVENLRVFRDEAGPDVFSTNAVEHGDTLISRYKAIDEARNADISAKYQALKDAAGGDFPVDTPALLNNVRGALKKDLATVKAPADVMSFLDEKAAAGGMSLEDFESLRTSLARIQRSAADGQERHAAGVIRRQIEEMPMRPEAENLKGLADQARMAARERFQAMDADPAYKAAVNDKVSPDAFVQKFVIGGTRDNVAKLSEAMSGDEVAKQTVKVATLDHLRKAAGIDPDFNGNFTQAGYNKALQHLSPKLLSLLDPKTAEQVSTLGDVARYTQFQPRGSFVNNSNTFVAAAGAKAADALEGAINYKMGGIPVASAVRNSMNEAKLRKQAEATFAPGAGLTKLSDIAKMGKEKK